MPAALPPYVPINCGFHDELLDRAVRKRPVRIVYREESEETSVTDVIEDVYSEGEAEYLRLRGGTVIRLDRLVSVDGLSLPPAC